MKLLNKDKILFDIYFLIDKFIKLIKYPPDKMLLKFKRKMFFYKYEKASKMKEVLPEYSFQCFMSLLNKLDKSNFLLIEQNNLKAKIYFHLATLVNDKELVKKYLIECISIMPEHKKAQEMYDGDKGTEGQRDKGTKGQRDRGTEG